MVKSDLVAPGLNMIGREAGCRRPGDVHPYLTNLNRLGLVWFSREEMDDVQRYQLLEAQQQAFADGRCMDCDKQMPGWPGKDGPPDKLPDGWAYFTDMKDEPMGWLCPDCDAADEAESER